MNTRRATLAVLFATAALALAACGDDETTVTETSATPAPVTSTTTPTTTPTSTTTAPTSTTATTTSASTTTSPADNCNYNEGQIYSTAAGGCVDQRSGDNPCPKGEVPMADQAVCVKE
jgi:hypothetical protein